MKTLAIDDFGPVGRGASQAHVVLAENGNEYIIKGPMFTPGSYVAANELVAAQLAGHLGLPILDYCIVELNGTLFSGSTHMPKGSFYPQTTETQFRACLNAERVYEIVAFDAFVCNVDRHHENLIVRVSRPRGAAVDQHLLLLNDHSHCLVVPGDTVASLTTRLGTGPGAYVSLPFVIDSITDSSRLTRAIDAIQGISDEVIDQSARCLPNEFYPAGGVQNYIDFLKQRRDELRSIFESDLAIFGNLKGGLS